MWQFKGLASEKLLSEMCFSSGRIKQVNWGWRSIPELEIDLGRTHLAYETAADNLLKPSYDKVEKLIAVAISDFKQVYGFI